MKSKSCDRDIRHLALREGPHVPGLEQEGDARDELAARGLVTLILLTFPSALPGLSSALPIMINLFTRLGWKHTTAPRTFLKFGPCGHEVADNGIRGSYQVWRVAGKSKFAGLVNSYHTPPNVFHPLVESSGYDRSSNPEIGGNCRKKRLEASMKMFSLWFGRGSPNTVCPVRRTRLSERFLAF